MGDEGGRTRLVSDWKEFKAWVVKEPGYEAYPDEHQFVYEREYTDEDGDGGKWVPSDRRRKHFSLRELRHEYLPRFFGADFFRKYNLFVCSEPFFLCPIIYGVYIDLL